MDVNAIRVDLATAMQDAGYEAKPFVPEASASFPAAVVGLPTEVDFSASLGLASVDLPISVAFQVGTYEDAQHSLDDAFSTEVDGSAVNVLRSLGQGTSWREVHVLSAGNCRMSEDGDVRVLAGDITVRVYARK